MYKLPKEAKEKGYKFANELFIPVVGEGDLFIVKARKCSEPDSSEQLSLIEEDEEC
jgi:hypothetical protein